MHTADFDYFLPPGLIAQAPAPERDQSRLLVMHRSEGRLEHRRFADLPKYLGAGDVLVLNNSKVIPARLRGRKTRGGAIIEMLLLEENSTNDWWAMLRPGKRVMRGTEILLSSAAVESAQVKASVLEKEQDGRFRLEFSGTENIRDDLDRLGETPLPPYIERPVGASIEDKLRYQTVYADPPGSVAAPTAGLHFTAGLLAELRSKGVQVCFVTLHVGLGTFAPVKAETVDKHSMHLESYEVGEETARVITAAGRQGRKIVAVGTTTVRVLETVASEHDDQIVACGGRTRLFIYPPYAFRVVRALVTNFHLPRSSLLMLVSAFAAPGATGGRELLLDAYAAAMKHGYLFYSYGDAMLIL